MKPSTPAIPKHIQDLIDQGYRRTSNRHGIVSRIDRPDWIEVLARHLHRSPAEFYKREEPFDVGDSWPGYYRRVISKDNITLDPPELAKLFPTSDWNATGYVEIPLDMEFIVV